MSRLPLSNHRIERNSSPPIKNRKKLDDSAILNSPVFSKSSEEPATTQRKMLSKPPSTVSGIPRAKINMPRSMGLHFNGNSLMDPDVQKRQQDNAAKERKVLEVQVDKLNQVNDKLDKVKIQLEEAKAEKTAVFESSRALKLKASDLEVGIMDLESQIESAQKKLDDAIQYEEKQNAIKLRKATFNLTKQTDDTIAVLEDALKEADHFHNDDLLVEIEYLKKEIEKKDMERSAIFEKMDRKLAVRKAELDKERTEMMKEEESKNSDFEKAFGEKTDESDCLKDELARFEEQIAAIALEIHAIGNESKSELDIQKDSNIQIQSLLAELKLLDKENTEIDSTLKQALNEADTVNGLYLLSKSKIEKEKNIRRRIQNSIEELVGRLRIYVRLQSRVGLDIHYDEKDYEIQTVQIDQQEFKFNKIFRDETDSDVIHEILTLTENTIKGADFVMLAINSGTEFLEKLSKSTAEFWKTRLAAVEKYQKWNYSYQFQIFEYDEQLKIFKDSTTGKEILLTTDDHRLVSDSALLESLESPPLHSSKFQIVNLIVTRSDDARSMASRCAFVQIPHSLINDHFKQLLRNFNKPSSPIKLPSPYCEIEWLLTNYKSLSMFTIDESDSTLLKVAKAMGTLETPTKCTTSPRAKSA